jgi:probable HAF family extracellular repeat protein
MKTPVILLATLGLPAAAASAQTISSIGYLLSTQPSTALALSRDGFTATGYAGTTLGLRAVRSIPNTPILNLDPTRMFIRCIGFAAADNGGAVTGVGVVSGGGHVFRWTPEMGLQDVGTLPGNTVSYGFAISADGSTIAGGPSVLGFGNAFVWTDGLGFTDLGKITSADGNSLFGLSADASVGAGASWSGGVLRAMRWTPSEGLVDFPLPPGATASEADAVSADGSTIVGFSTSPEGDRAFRWTAAGGFTDLGIAPGHTTSRALAVNRDGSIIAGSDESGAIVWTEDQGMTDLASYLSARGVSLTGWSLSICYGVSADATAFAGEGRLNGVVRGWVVRGVPAPPRCGTSDFDGDGDSGTDQDIEAFFACLAGSCCPTCFSGGADFNGDGDAGTDADIESFFRVLGGGAC